MDVKIKIYKKVREIDEGRSYTGYEEYYNPWATPIDLYGDEVYNALNAKLENVIVFEIKWCKKVEAMRTNIKDYVIEFEGEKFRIYHCSFKKNERKTVLLKASRDV